jgi:hypothetical protein
MDVGDSGIFPLIHEPGQREERLMVGHGGLRVAGNGWWLRSAQFRPIKERNKDFRIS